MWLPDAFIVITFAPALPETSAIVSSRPADAGGSNILVGPDDDTAKKEVSEDAVIGVPVFTETEL